MSETADPSNHPRCCEHVLGHDDILTALTSEQKRRHHGIILSGPRGIGKASLAYRVAEHLFSAQNGEVDLLGSALNPKDSPETALIRAGSHPDMLVIEADNEKGTSRISVEQIRRIPPFLSHTPSRGALRLVIIDALDEMNFNGANAMLKTLEEPPERALILLIHHLTVPIMPTIRSRCQVIKLSPLATDETRLVIGRAFPDADPDWINVATVLSEGAPGRAQMIAESGAIDLYAETCSILASAKASALSLDDVAQLWGQGGAKNIARRSMMRLLFDRLARLSAQRAAGYTPSSQQAGLDLENQAIQAITGRVSAPQLAEIQQNMMRKIDEAERLNLDLAITAHEFLSELASG